MYCRQVVEGLAARLNSLGRQIYTPVGVEEDRLLDQAQQGEVPEEAVEGDEIEQQLAQIFVESAAGPAPNFATSRFLRELDTDSESEDDEELWVLDPDSPGRSCAESGSGSGRELVSKTLEEYQSRLAALCTSDKSSVVASGSPVAEVNNQQRSGTYGLPADFYDSTSDSSGSDSDSGPEAPSQPMAASVSRPRNPVGRTLSTGTRRRGGHGYRPQCQTPPQRRPVQLQGDNQSLRQPTGQSQQRQTLPQRRAVQPLVNPPKPAQVSVQPNRELQQQVQQVNREVSPARQAQVAAQDPSAPPARQPPVLKTPEKQILKELYPPRESGRRRVIAQLVREEQETRRRAEEEKQQRQERKLRRQQQRELLRELQRREEEAAIEAALERQETAELDEEDRVRRIRLLRLQEQQRESHLAGHLERSRAQLRRDVAEITPERRKDVPSPI
ncbi:hypothetical protein F4810DRAFT_189605 [Camillea tinctor]|nr:hypothetical protein F4810DRAFT_189605 [Camillea tinctor]